MIINKRNTKSLNEYLNIKLETKPKVLAIAKENLTENGDIIMCLLIK